ncbi:MAG: laccase domain-containing protein [Desulfovibrio sp.]|nr:laccase domain-containing protein [Desulfovibrio sp.]
MSLTWFRFPGVPRVCCAFQGRALPASGAGAVAPVPWAGGNISFNTGDDPAATAAARAALLSALRPRGLDTWAEVRQVHGDALVEEPFAPEASALPAYRMEDSPEADGMFTSAPGKGLLIKTADCQPLLLAHRSGRHVAALHVGWRGNRCDLPASGLVRFCAAYGLDPADIFAVRGPSLGPSRAEFVNHEREWGDSFRPWFDAASRCMDLWGLTASQLEAAGVPRRQIFGLDICTSLNAQHYFSHRHDARSGRQASLIWIEA